MADEKELNPRDAALAAIHEGDLANKTAEFKEGGGNIDDLMPPGAVVEAPQRPEDVSEEEWGQMSDEAKGAAVRASKPAEVVETDEERATREQAEAAAKAKEKIKTVKIKVDGVETEVPEAEIMAAGIKARQQETAADKRLDEAKVLLREARELRESLGTGQNQTQALSGEVDYDAVAHAIQYGSKEEARDALKKLQSTGTLPNQQIIQMIDERAQFQDAVSFYRSEYKEIATDPDWHKLFLLKEREARAGGNTKSYRDLYKEIGDELLPKIKSLTPAPVDQLAAKRDAKKSMTPQPVSAAARQPAPQATKEPTPSEIVEKMRAQRNQT